MEIKNETCKSINHNWQLAFGMLLDETTVIISSKHLHWFMSQFFLQYEWYLFTEITLAWSIIGAVVSISSVAFITTSLLKYLIGFWELGLVIVYFVPFKSFWDRFFMSHFNEFTSEIPDDPIQVVPDILESFFYIHDNPYYMTLLVLESHTTFLHIFLTFFTSFSSLCSSWLSFISFSIIWFSGIFLKRF